MVAIIYTCKTRFKVFPLMIVMRVYLINSVQRKNNFPDILISFSENVYNRSLF